jgi:hypothetical protein
MNSQRVLRAGPLGSRSNRPPGNDENIFDRVQREVNSFSLSAPFDPPALLNISPAGSNEEGKVMPPGGQRGIYPLVALEKSPERGENRAGRGAEGESPHIFELTDGLYQRSHLGEISHPLEGNDFTGLNDFCGNPLYLVGNLVSHFMRGFLGIDFDHRFSGAGLRNAYPQSDNPFNV